MAKKQYRAKVALYFPVGQQVAAGEVSDKIPLQSIPWLLHFGYIEAVENYEEVDNADVLPRKQK